MRLSAELIDALHSAALVPEDVAADRRQRAQQHKNPTVLKPPRGTGDQGKTSPQWPCDPAGGLRREMKRGVERSAPEPFKERRR